MIDSLVKLVRQELYEVPSGTDLFNPYHDLDPELDSNDAVSIRRENLESYLRTHGNPRILLVAEAPGPWGCRFSGVPITSEAQLTDPSFPINGSASSRLDSPHAEYSATIFWDLLAQVHEKLLVWNTVPLHPHRSGEPLTIRTPRQSEIDRFAPLLGSVVEISKASVVVSVGRKAERALSTLGIPSAYIRHPSQGGANLFREGMRSILLANGIRIVSTAEAQ